MATVLLLLNSASLRDLELSGREVLQGIYAGGMRDDPEVRFAMEARYDITIGGGKCYLVDTRVMDDMDLNGDILAHSAHEDMIDYYREVGLIVADEGADGPDVQYMYIRHRRGRGASDDTAIVCAGMLWVRVRRWERFWRMRSILWRSTSRFSATRTADWRARSRTA